MTEIPGLVASIGGAIVVAAFVAGLAIRLIGGLLHRSFWKLGARLYAAVIGAGLPVVSGAFLLTMPLSLDPGDRWLALGLVPAGLLGLTIGAFAVRWIASYEIPDADWQRAGSNAKRT